MEEEGGEAEVADMAEVSVYTWCASIRVFLNKLVSKGSGGCYVFLESVM